MRVWRPPSFSGVELTDHTSSNVSFGAVSLTTYSFGVRRAGVRRTKHRRTSFITHPGMFLAYAPGDALSAQPLLNEVWSHRELSLNREACEALLSEGSRALAHDFEVPMVADAGLNGRLYGLFMAYFDSFSHGAPLLEQQSRLLVLLEVTFAHFAPSIPTKVGREPGTVARVKDYLRARFAESVTLEALASFTGLSKYYLLRTFKHHVGVSPHVYQRQLRVDRAKELVSSSVPSAQAALEVGYTDQSHFHHAFKRHTFVTPRQFQKDSMRTGRSAFWTAEQS